MMRSVTLRTTYATETQTTCCAKFFKYTTSNDAEDYPFFKFINLHSSILGYRVEEILSNIYTCPGVSFPVFLVSAAIENYFKLRFRLEGWGLGCGLFKDGNEVF